ncbi:MAG: SPOR domain-containing protein [Lamprobacter sp.]|uniref:SPOR domain-containing protein n=1 Tax=Lamprobacter sp. TaxID=3100796 RepID=UPI002B261DBF|nr:SPOR domain-containing protein [Lamprobacter sp.]MEA3639434.1 SPOR domain-containing protein [Lamprobacter sp.]
MDEAAKRRLVGAAVLVALAVIFVPMLVEHSDDEFGEPIIIPEVPEQDDALGGDAETLMTESGSEWPLPEPDDVPLPLPTPEPPGSALDAEPLAADVRSTVPSEASRSSAERPARESSATASGARPDRARGEATAPATAGPKPIPPGTRAWVIQVASLGSPEAARSLQDELRTKGYPAFVEQADVGGRRYYRVRVGPEIERARADRLATQLASDTGAQPLVQRYP